MDQLQGIFTKQARPGHDINQIHPGMPKAGQLLKQTLQLSVSSIAASSKDWYPTTAPHLVDGQVRIGTDDRPSTEVHALAGQVAPESTLLALQPLDKAPAVDGG